MTRLLLSTVIGALAATLSVAAQSADDRELMQYRLTPEVLAKAEAVASAFSANVGKDPRMKRRFEAQQEIAVLEDKDTLTQAEQARFDALQEIVGDDAIDLGINGGSLSEISAQLQKLPAMAAALTSAGMAPRDMAKFVVTAVQAAMIGGLQGRGIPIPPGACRRQHQVRHGESGGCRADQQTARRPLSASLQRMVSMRKQPLQHRADPFRPRQLAVRRAFVLGVMQVDAVDESQSHQRRFQRAAHRRDRGVLPRCPCRPTTRDCGLDRACRTVFRIAFRSHHTDGDSAATRPNTAGCVNARCSDTSPPSEEPAMPVLSRSVRVR